MNLRTLRIKTGLTQRKAANLLGFTTAQTISNIERGVAPLPAKHVRKFAKVYKASPKKIARIAVSSLVSSYMKRAGL